MVKEDVVQTNTKQELIAQGKDYVTFTKKEVIELLQQVDGIKRKLKAKLQTV